MPVNDYAIDRLRITAELHRGRHIVAINNDLARLALTQFAALVTLVCSLFIRSRGYTAITDLGADPNTVYKTIERLRRDIDAAAGEGAGVALILTLGRGIYKLSLDPNAVEIDADLRCLAPRDLGEQEVDVLYRHARVCQADVLPLSANLAHHVAAEKGNANAT
jgi:hypothetical protein